jgi:hypothetical protein
MGSLDLLPLVFIAGCASYDYTQECEQDETWDTCVEEVRTYRDQLVTERYRACRKLYEYHGVIWEQYGRGPVRRDRRTGEPRSSLDKKQEIAQNGCKL